ncbi:MAG: putative HTH-type transcriptional regulator YfiR [Chloroflexi bacterium]|nr:putative HTH-type transcriptional regulator YfiR [Chloroflexota bacterium]
MSPRPDRREERTTQIIEAAMAVFAEKGFNAARMSDIADEAGVSKGTLYFYFEEGKDAIIRTILKAILGRELSMARRLLAVEKTSLEKLDLLTEAMLEDLKKIKPLLSLYFDFMAMAMRREAVHDVIKKTFREYTEIIENLVQQGIDNGELRPVDVREAALTIGAIFEGTLLLWAYDSTLVDFETHIKTGTQLLLDGLKTS